MIYFVHTYYSKFVYIYIIHYMSRMENHTFFEKVSLYFVVLTQRYFYAMEMSTQLHFREKLYYIRIIGRRCIGGNAEGGSGIWW